MKNLLIVTGGSGGHVIPSISLFEHLKKKFKVEIVSDLRGSNYIDKQKYNYSIVDVPNLFSKPYLFPIKLLKYLNNIIKSLNFLKKNNISIIISTGGYMSLPFCIAAYLLKKKIFLFEPNSVLGRSNKLVLKFSDKIICYDTNLKNFPKKYDYKKVKIYPILRSQIYTIKKNSKNYNKKNIKILVIGGSQGASFFDNKISDLIVEISKLHKIEIIQQISNDNTKLLIKEKYENAKINFNFFKFTDKSDKIYQGVNLAISRGGAITLSELAYLNIPFIVIPLPSARDNHQFYNSEYYFQKKVCWIIDQKKLDVNQISNLISNLFKNDKDYANKIHQLEELNKKNNWNTINNHIIEIVNEN